MAKFDEIMDRAEESFNRIMEGIEVPRPGATPTSREDMLREFQAIQLDPDGLTLKRTELDRAHGPTEGAKQFVKWWKDLSSG